MTPEEQLMEFMRGSGTTEFQEGKKYEDYKTKVPIEGIEKEIVGSCLPILKVRKCWMFTESRTLNVSHIWRFCKRSYLL